MIAALFGAAILFIAVLLSQKKEQKERMEVKHKKEVEKLDRLRRSPKLNEFYNKASSIFNSLKSYYWIENNEQPLQIVQDLPSSLLIKGLISNKTHLCLQIFCSFSEDEIKVELTIKPIDNLRMEQSFRKSFDFNEEENVLFDYIKTTIDINSPT